MNFEYIYDVLFESFWGRMACQTWLASWGTESALFDVSGSILRACVIHIACQSGFLDPQGRLREWVLTEHRLCLKGPSGRTAFLSLSWYIVFLINVTFWCVLLVAVAFFVYAVVLFCLLWHFNVSVVPSVCCGVCLFVIAGGVSLLWRYRFAAVLFGLLWSSSVCCCVFLFAVMFLALLH